MAFNVTGAFSEALKIIKIGETAKNTKKVLGKQEETKKINESSLALQASKTLDEIDIANRKGKKSTDSVKESKNLWKKSRLIIDLKDKNGIVKYGRSEEAANRAITLLRERKMEIEAHKRLINFLPDEGD